MSFASEEEMLISSMSGLPNEKEDEAREQNNKQLDNSVELPLPTENELDEMLAEIRQVEQEEAEKLSDETIGTNVS